MSRMKLLLDIVQDMKELSESLMTFAEAFESVDADKPVQEQPKKVVTLEEVRTVLSEMSRAGKAEQVRKLLLQHGGNKLSAIDPAEFPTLIEEARKL